MAAPRPTMLRSEQPTAEGAISVREWLLSDPGRAVDSLEFDGAALQNLESLQEKETLRRFPVDEFEVMAADEFDKAYLFPTIYEDGFWNVPW